MSPCKVLKYWIILTFHLLCTKLADHLHFPCKIQRVDFLHNITLIRLISQDFFVLVKKKIILNLQHNVIVIYIVKKVFTINEK